MSEMQRLTGLARQTLYRHLPPEGKDERNPPRPQASMEVLLLLAAEAGYASPALLARRAGLNPALVVAVVTDLDAEQLCTLRRDAYASLEAAPTAETYVALREHFDDLYLRRPDAFSVYVRVPEQHQSEIATAASGVLASEEHVLVEPTTAPSLMDGPELAFKVNAPTVRRALAVTRDVWEQILEEAGVDYFEPVIANVIPPAARPLVTSDVLDNFVEAAVDGGAPHGDALREIRTGYSGGVPDRVLAGRCVTSAALALRRTVGNANEPRPIHDGDTAFAELQPAAGVPVNRETAAIKRATVDALELATDRLGPLPGGRLGSFRAPDAPPNIIEEVRLTDRDLVEMARLSGDAVGAAAALGKIDASAALRRILAGD